MKSKGFTLVEVLVVGFFVAVLYTIATASLFRGQRSTNVSEVSRQLVQDLREAQIQAMTGKTSSSGALLDRSVRFETDRYILYPGLVYDSGNSENRVVTIPTTMQFTAISVSGNTVTFARGGGDVRDFVAGQDSVTLSDTAIGKSDRFLVNRRGVVNVTHE